MKIVSFNINGVRARPHQLEALVETHRPEVIGLQETKVQDQDFPRQVAEKLGYQLHIHGQKGHYGVALLCRGEPTEVVRGLPGDAEDEQRRLISALIDTDFGPCWVHNGYFPQGESRDHPWKFPYKRKFYRRLTEHLHQRHGPDEAVVVMGDLNISPEDEDIGIGEDNRKRWLRTGKCSFLPEEREWLQTLTHRQSERWLTDSWRHQNPGRNDLFSWFDYRSRGFEGDPKRGLRIDHVWVTEPLKAALKATGVDYDIRAMEKPSDHCPVWAEFG